MKKLTAAIGLCAALTLPPLPAAAQDYPTKPLRVIASQGPGGLSDVFMRALAEELRPGLGVPVVVENRTGAGGTIGARACGEAAPDGYTICIIPGEPVLFNPLTLKGVQFDPKTALTPVTRLFYLAQVIAVNADLKVKTMQDLAALSKAKPGTLSYTAPSLPKVVLMEQFKRDTGADLVRVPFRGGGEAVTGMLTGTTPVAIFGVGNLVSHLREGKIVGIAIDTEQRSPLFPDIPTFHEIGIKGDVMPAFFGIFAPAGTPKPIVERLQREIAKAASKPEFRQRHMIERGLDPVLNTPQQFAKELEEERAAAERVVKASGMYPAK